MGGALALALLAAACDRAPSAAGRNARGLPNPVLTDQHGQKLRFYDDVVAGHTVVVQFMYTRCDGICPAATGNVVAARREIADGPETKNLRFVSISLDPGRDSAEDLAQYAQSSGMPEDWVLLTGSPEDIEDLRYALGAYDLDPEVDAKRSNHSAALVIGNDARDRWMMVSGISNGSAIARSVRRML